LLRLKTHLGKPWPSACEKERGRTEINAEDFLATACALERPIAYLYPDHPKVRGARLDELENAEKELISSYRLVQNEQLEHVALRQVELPAKLALEDYYQEATRDAEAARAELHKGAG
jgi:hypothetical protein